ADLERVGDGGAIERPAQHLAVVGEGEARALAVEQAGAEHVEQRPQQEETEEGEAQHCDGDGQALLRRDHGTIVSWLASKASVTACPALSWRCGASSIAMRSTVPLASFASRRVSGPSISTCVAVAGRRRQPAGASSPKRSASGLSDTQTGA